MLQEQSWQLVSAITASIAASSVSSDLQHVEKHGFALMLLTYENGECWLQKEFDEADVLALLLIQKRFFCKRWNTTQTTLLQSQSGPQLLVHPKCVNGAGKMWIQLGVHSCAKHLLTWAKHPPQRLLLALCLFNPYPRKRNSFWATQLLLSLLQPPPSFSPSPKLMLLLNLLPSANSVISNESCAVI